MNGRRRKALRREFREQNERDPLPTMAVLIDNQETFVNVHGQKQFAAGYEKNGELHFRKTMGVGKPSEWRQLKREFRNNFEVSGPKFQNI